MAAPKKPTKQQIEQGKARAGGNNPIKVTDKGLKKLGKAAAIAATIIPAGRAVAVGGKVAAKVAGQKAGEKLLGAVERQTEKVVARKYGSEKKIVAKMQKGMVKSAKKAEKIAAKGMKK